jgi:hypothetical protein
MIYDCFTFSNELDLLELRLKLHSDSVDRFVIVEATQTFRGDPKPLHYQDNADRFAEYQDRIIHVVVDDMPDTTDPWVRERFQRDAIMRGLTSADANDIAIIGDVDEFLRAESVAELHTSTASIFAFRVPYFNFKFNHMLIGNPESYSVWTMATRVGSLTSPDDLRSQRRTLNEFAYDYDDGTVRVLEHAGWHWTYQGDNDFIRNKIRSFSHSELDRPELLAAIDVDRAIAEHRGFNPEDNRRFVPVALDNYFPEIIRESANTIPGSTRPARSYLRPNTSNLDLVTLSQILPTDKERAHRYVSNFYAQEFDQYRARPVTLLEIGIWNGGSVAMWNDYFPEGRIIGTDITSERFTIDMSQLPRAEVHIRDAYTQEFADSLPDLDIVIDDGPHTEDSQARCLALYAPKLAAGGVLVIEDILSDASIPKFQALVPANCTYEVRDIRPKSNLPESLMFIVRRK